MGIIKASSQDSGFHLVSFQVGQASAGGGGTLACEQAIRNAKLQASVALPSIQKTQKKEYIISTLSYSLFIYHMENEKYCENGQLC